MRKVFLVLRDIYKKLPFISNRRGLFAAFCRIYGFFYGLTHGTTYVRKTIDSVNYELDLNQLIDSSIFFYGCFEPDTVEVINRLCKPGMTVVDIGANIGCHTLRFAKITGPQGKVYAFEPMTWAFEKLKKNISLNDFGNVVLENKALSDKAAAGQTVSFASSWPLSMKGKPHTVESNTVDLATLDGYFAEKRITKLDLIKLDVDGYEPKVLRGAEKTLRTFKPVIIMEVAPHLLEKAGGKAVDMLEYILSLGYAIHPEDDLSKALKPAEILAMIPSDESINIIVSAK